MELLGQAKDVSLETIAAKLHRAENQGKSILPQLYGLKLVNDVFGHEQGDRLLVAMAKVLTQ